MFHSRCINSFTTEQINPASSLAKNTLPLQDEKKQKTKQKQKKNRFSYD